MNKNKNKENQDSATPKDWLGETAAFLSETIMVVILALLFVTFVMRTFIIPTGSMADTLRGAHFQVRCQQCGYEYTYGFIPEKYGLKEGMIPPFVNRPQSGRCPSCGYYQSIANRVSKGDKIMVLKWVYNFLEPKRWDVMVFRYPAEPHINYIKRLVAKPGESVQIIDGDIYINGKIARKPQKLQKQLWIPLYDNDYQPIRPKQGSFNGHIWQQPFRNAKGSIWKTDKDNPTIFKLDDASGNINTFVYDSTLSNGFRATCAYNDIYNYKNMPYCSDLMVRFYVTAKQTFTAGAVLEKYGIAYKGGVLPDGKMAIARIDKQSKSEELASKTLASCESEKPILFKFSNVDHRLILEFGNDKLVYDIGKLPTDAGQIKPDIEPAIKIIGTGNIALSHIALYRDIHYFSNQYGNNKQARAAEENAFVLGENEFFMLGDNSASSFDGRWWDKEGVGNFGPYRVGTVPRDYLVGKALFVFWPGGYRPFSDFPFSCVPSVTGMRPIHGGQIWKADSLD